MWHKQSTTHFSILRGLQTAVLDSLPHIPLHFTLCCRKQMNCHSVSKVTAFCRHCFHFIWVSGRKVSSIFSLPESFLFYFLPAVSCLFDCFQYVVETSSDHLIHPFPLKFNSKAPFPVSLFHPFCLLDQPLQLFPFSLQISSSNFSQNISSNCIPSHFTSHNFSKLSSLILGFCFSLSCKGLCLCQTAWVQMLVDSAVISLILGVLQE